MSKNSGHLIEKVTESEYISRADAKDNITPRECKAMRLLHLDGWSNDELEMMFMVGENAVRNHTTGRCSHFERESRKMVENQAVFYRADSDDSVLHSTLKCELLRFESGAKKVVRSEDSHGQLRCVRCFPDEGVYYRNENTGIVHVDEGCWGCMSAESLEKVSPDVVKDSDICARCG